MIKRYPCGTIARREFLTSAAASTLPLLVGTQVSAAMKDEPKAAAKKTGKPVLGDGSLGLPGPYPGRVVEVRNKAMIKDGVKNREAIKASLARAMKELTGSDEAVDAWKTFVEPGDVVGIKVVPNGFPNVHTSFELVLEVIAALEAAGLKKRDMIVFDRYKSEFMSAGYHKIVPDGVLWGGETSVDDGSQLLTSFPGNDPVAGYDPDEFMEMNLVHRGHDPKDDRNYRSHLGLVVTRRVNKLILLPVVKDHGSAGVTGCLKNMSHGLVNNVARSHSSPDTNVCNQFIPQVVDHPIIRKKCVLQIMDGIRAVYQGGPFGYANNKHWSWERNSLFCATDPVALDRIEWGIIDAKRKEMGLPPVGSVGKLGLDSEREGFDMRQPQHIGLAGNLGLGIYDLKSPLGRRHSIDHRVVEI
ncbi:MAG: DUF362 domain-containing protein [Isosphaeraceae bacterium]|nr:DUF362 domain-containing protein [Isosphaeraceae bacterium]